MSLLLHKIAAIKKQVENDNFLKERNLESTAAALTQRYLSSHFGRETSSEKLLQLKANNNEHNYNDIWGFAEPAKDLWQRDDYNDVIPKLVIYWNKKLYEAQATAEDFLNTKQELPSGPVKFFPEKAQKMEIAANSSQFGKLIFGDLNYNLVDNKILDVIVVPDPKNILDIWTVEESYVSHIPVSDMHEYMKQRLLPYLYKKVDINFHNEKMISQEENDKISQAKEYIKNKESFLKAANMDSLRIASSAFKAAQISVNTKDSTYPIFTEIIFSGKRIAAPTLALYRAVNLMSIHDSCDFYYDEAGQKLIVSSETAFAIMDTTYENADLWDTLNMEAFVKGITARQVQKIEEVVVAEHFTTPVELLERKPKLNEILERQKSLVPKFLLGGTPKVNVYDEIVTLAHEYIASYTKIVNERGVETRKAVIPQHKLNNLSYVYEPDDIFWEYNPDIEVEELLAFFVSKGKNESYQILCLKILGIDYMLNYNVLVDALIEKRLLMIDTIKIDYVTKKILELKYEYLHFYASGNIYAKKKQLEAIQNDLLEYYGSDNGMRIIAAQNEILDERLPAQCLIISAEKDKQLELDINHEMFFAESFPPISTRSSVGVKSIRDQFKDFFHKIPKLGGLTDSEIEDGYFEPLDKAGFIRKYILPGWKHKGRTYKFKSSSWTSIAEELKLKPVNPPTRFNKKTGEPIVYLSDYSTDDQITVKEIQRAIIAAYHERTTRIKNEGSRIFNLFLKSEVTNSFQQLISQIWNEKYNNYSAALLTKVPTFFRIARYFGPDNKLFRLKKVQVNGVKFSSARDNSALLAHEVGYGKMQPLDSKLLTPNGWIKMGDVKIGDCVIGVNGKPTEVMGIFPHGEKDIYKITFDDGSSTECGKEHLWTYKSLHHRHPDKKNALKHGWNFDTNWQTKELSYFIEQGIKNNRGNKKFNIPIVAPVHFKKQELEIHPYLLGALLGDGSLSIEGSVGFTNIDKEIIDKVSLFLPNDELKLKKQGKSYCNYRISRSPQSCYGKDGKHIKNEIAESIKHLGLAGAKSHQKFIPDIYKYNTVENRILLLQGLLDTDGYCAINKRKGKKMNSSSVSYCTVSKKLKDDIIFLVRSLGGITTVYEKIPSYTYKGEKLKGQLAYNININLPPHIIPFTVTRKLEKHIPKNKYQPSRFITNIEYVGVKPAQCIKVANEDGLYVTDDFIVTHNTTTSLVAISHWMETGEASRVLTLTPKRVYEKFLREGKGAGNFRGAVPHINFVELYNAKPDVFMPIVNQKGEVIKWNLKHYEKDDLKTIEFYRQAVAEIARKADAMPNRRLEPDDASIKMIEETIAKYVQGYTQHKFLDFMVKKFEANKSYTNSAIKEEIEQVEAKQGAITPKEEGRIKAKLGRIFSDEVMDTLYAMKNIMIDEMGTFFPDVFKPKSIILATHVAIEDLRPSQVGIDEAISAIDDVNNTRWSRKEDREIPDARDKTLEWSFILNNNPISVERLNIDGIVVDEVHNFNELVSKIRPRYYTKKKARSRDEITYLQLPIGSRDSIGRHVMRYYYSMPSETNKDKVNLMAIVMDIAAKNKDNKQNAIMLSATPFTEGPLHMFSVMNLVNRRRLKSLNMASSYNFFMNFIWEAWKFDVTIDGRKGLFATVDKYRNNMGLCNFMAAFSDFKITDEEIEKLRPVKYIIPDDENRIGGLTSYVPLTEVQKAIKFSIGEFIAGRIKEEDICRITKQEDIEEIDEDASSFDAEALVESGNLRKQEVMSARIFKAKSMQEKMVISPYLMGCLPEGVKLPPLDDILRNADGSPILWEGKEVSAAPKHFVENSPKILYAINCIQSVLEKHEQDGTRPSGQIIYLNMGKDFVYQNVRYKGGVYQLIAEYLTHPVYRPDIGLVPSDIGVIHGGITDEGLVTEVQRKFNDGRIKVLLGSASIREGIDLQENSTAMYIINAEYNPTNAMQLEGRIWRQGNKWKNVRVVYVLAYDSIDVFIYSKLKNKINSVREIMRAGKCDLNETHTFSLDPGEVQINLTTNVNDLADLSWQSEERKLRMELERRNSEINLLRLIHKNYPKIKTEYDNLLKQLNYLSEELEKVKYNDLKDSVEHKIRSAEREKPIEQQMSSDDIEKQAEALIADGTYKRTYEHVDFKADMSYTLFQQRLDVLRSNYKIARQWEGRMSLHEKEIEDLRKQIDGAEIQRDKMQDDIQNRPFVEPTNLEDLGKPDQRLKALAEAERFIEKWKNDLNRALTVKTKQQLYWDAIIKVGFRNFEDYEKTVNKFTSGSDNDTVLNAFNSQVTAAGMKFSDVNDIIESQQNEIRTISDRINNKDKEVQKLVVKYTKLLEDRKKAGKFSLYDQIAAFESTNFLVQ